MKKYVYATIPNDQKHVRLLRLLPGMSDLRCELFMHQLNNRQPFEMYEALSYTWGEHDRLRQLFIKNENETDFACLYITSNLFTALQYLRDPTLPRNLWIDALCINQGDLIERSHQVAFMSKIYLRASQVVVWLGDHEGETGLLEDQTTFQHIRDLSKAVFRPSLGIVAHRIQPLLELLSRQWFTRIWILQEVAAARSLSIMCGAVEMSGSAFFRGIEAYLPVLIQRDPMLRNYILTISNLITWAGEGASKRHDSPCLDLVGIGELVEMFHNRKATDVRDKVFALLGLSLNEEPRLRPDYTKTWSEVLRDFITHVLGESVKSQTWDGQEHAVIIASGWLVGHVEAVNDGSIEVRSRQFDRRDAEGTGEPAWLATWRTYQYCKDIRPGDILCRLNGSSYPTIIRHCGDHFDIIVISLTTEASAVYEDKTPAWSPKRSLPHLHSRFLDTWYPKHTAWSNRQFLLVWDWQTIHETTASGHRATLSGTECTASLESHTTCTMSNITLARYSHVARILDDLKYDPWRSDIVQRDVAKALVSWKPSAATHACTTASTISALRHRKHSWLTRYVERTHQCIVVLRSWRIENTIFKGDGQLVDEEILLQGWVHERRYDYGVFGVLDLEKDIRTGTLPDSMAILDIRSEPASQVYSQPGNFGERDHIQLLEDMFPSYKARSSGHNTISSAEPGFTIPFNGRYLIRLMLSPESFDVRSIRILTRRLLRRPLRNKLRNILMLTMLSEVSDHQLPIDIQGLSDLRQTEEGQEILAFLFVESWNNHNIVREIIRLVLLPPYAGNLDLVDADTRERLTLERAFRGDFMKTNENVIVNHLRRIGRDKSTFAALKGDFVFDALYEFGQDAGIREAERTSNGKNVAEGICQWVLSLKSSNP